MDIYIQFLFSMQNSVWLNLFESEKESNLMITDILYVDRTKPNKK
jgi:hypothetical protein